MNKNPAHSGRCFSGNYLKRQSLLYTVCFQILLTQNLAYSASLQSLYSTESKIIATDGREGDHFAKTMAMYGDTVIIGAGGHDGQGIDSGAAYIYEKNQYGTNNWGEVIKLTADDGHAGKIFGNSVAISGNTVAVGALGDNEHGQNSGAVYVFYNTQGSWFQVAKLSGEDGVEGDRFGQSVAINGDIIIVGAHNHDTRGIVNSGAVYLFGRHQGGVDNWGQISELSDPRGSENDRFGVNVAIDGDIVAIGADNKDAELLAGVIVPENYLPQPRFTFTKESDGFCGTDVGAVFIFSRHQGGVNHWGQVYQFTLTEGECSDHFGSTLAISGDTVAVGVSEKDIYDLLYAGKVYIYSRNQGGVNIWGETAIITAGDAREGDHFGHSIALQGDKLAVGAEGDNQGGFGAGSATLFTLQNNGLWNESLRLYAGDATSQDSFGSSIAMSDQAIVVGAVEDDDSGLSSGSAYVFHAGQLPVHAASYSFPSGVLSLKAVDVPGLGLYRATLSLKNADHSLFAVDRLDPVENPTSAIANYSVKHQALHIPSVELVGEKGRPSTYVVDLQLINNSPLQFKLIRVR